MVQVARALAQTPRILMPDKFTSHLDLSYKYEIIKILQDALKKELRCFFDYFINIINKSGLGRQKDICLSLSCMIVKRNL